MIDRVWVMYYTLRFKRLMPEYLAKVRDGIIMGMGFAIGLKLMEKLLK